MTIIERRFSDAEQSRSRLAVNHTSFDTIVKVRITQASTGEAAIMAYIHYKQGLEGLQVLNPVISIGMTLPNSSLVFTTVMSGDVDRLKRLLAGRQCTLRDRDEYGTPLLHVRHLPIPHRNLFLTGILLVCYEAA
jgi:hypothetical protein